MGCHCLLPSEKMNEILIKFEVYFIAIYQHWFLCSDKHWGTRVSFDSGFLSDYAQQGDCWVIRQFYFQFFKESPHCHALEKEIATHYSVLAWRIPGTGEPGGLPSMGLHRVGHD